MLIIEITKQMPVGVNEAIKAIIDSRLQELQPLIDSETKKLNQTRMNIINSNLKPK